MTSENDFIEDLSGTIGEGKLDPILGTRYFLDSGIKPDAVAQLGDDFVDVGAGTSLEYSHTGRSATWSILWFSKKLVTNSMGNSPNLVVEQDQRAAPKGRRKHSLKRFPNPWVFKN